MAATSVQAATYYFDPSGSNYSGATWDTGTNWNTVAGGTGANVAWPGTAYVADFGGTAGASISVNNPVTAAGITFDSNGNGDTISGSSAITLSATPVTVGSGYAATISAPLAGTAGFDLEGGGTLSLGGINTLTAGAASNSFLIGQTSASNTLNITAGSVGFAGSPSKLGMTIGGGAAGNGNNTVNISVAGTKSSPSFQQYGSGEQLNIGVNSSNNSLALTNSAYFYEVSSGGTQTWTIGTNAGANNNSVSVSGSGTTIDRSSAGGSYFTIGSNGSSNMLSVLSGGTVITARLGIGQGTGGSNAVTVDGSSSKLTISASTQNASFLVGGTTGNGGSNTLTVQNSGQFSFTGTDGGNNEKGQFSVGAFGNSSGITVTGGSSSMSVSYDIPMAIGGSCTQASGANAAVTVNDTGGTGNYLSVSNGATVTSNTSIYVMGNSAGAAGTGGVINLGNGSGTK